MQTRVVQSTTLAVIAYDEGQQKLHLQFRDRTIYTYFDVPADIFQGLLHARSAGKYFNAYVRGQFAYERAQRSSQLSSVIYPTLLS